VQRAVVAPVARRTPWEQQAMLGFDRRPLDTRAVRQTVALVYYMETDTHFLEVDLEEDLEEGRNGLVQLKGSSVAAAVRTRRTPRKV
jgi:hypothetical protein